VAGAPKVTGGGVAETVVDSTPAAGGSGFEKVNSPGVGAAGFANDVDAPLVGANGFGASVFCSVVVVVAPFEGAKGLKVGGFCAAADFAGFAKGLEAIVATGAICVAGLPNGFGEAAPTAGEAVLGLKAFANGLKGVSELDGGLTRLLSFF